MKRSAYIAAIVGLLVLAGCDQKEDDVVTPVAQAPQTAQEPQQPARLDTAMKSSQESAAAVNQSNMPSESGMKEATSAMTKQTEATVKTETSTATAKATTSAEQKVAEQVKGMPTSKEAAATAPVSASKETTTTAAKTVETAMAGGDAAKGAALMKKRCSMCHYFDSTKKKVGPGLKGVYGRAPSITGVPFTKWDAAALDKWLTKPKAVKPNTKMAFPGFPNKADRDDVIANLKTL